MNKKTALIAIICILLFQIIFLANYRLLVFNQEYYQENFKKSGTYQMIPNADIAAKDLIGYFQGKNGVSSIFNERESEHMEDVKELIQKANNYLSILLISAFGALAAFLFTLKKGYSRFIFQILFFPAAAVLALSLLLFLAYSLFPQLFEAFHLTFFTPGSYVFPENSTIIKLFPEQFFRNFAYDIIRNSAITSIALLVFSAIFHVSINKSSSCKKYLYKD